MPRTDDEGNVVGTFGISRDITARKQAESELREAEERYRSVVDALGEGIVLQAARRRDLRRATPRPRRSWA